jgi:small multidrug resistance family-3 protein
MTFAIYALAAAAEIAGCFAMWAWLRNGAHPLWLLPGLLALILFAYLLTRVDTEAAGRAFAAYGGIYIVASLVWLRLVDGVSLDRWDVTGAAFCLVETVIILLPGGITVLTPRQIRARPAATRHFKALLQRLPPRPPFP